MEIHITREDFLKELQRIQSIVERRNTTPILTNFLLEATADEVSISATDLELGFRGTLHAQTIVPGSLALAARQTYDIVRELFPESEIVLTTPEQNWAQLTAGRAIFKIPSLRGEDFPPLPSYDEKEGVMLQDQTFREMITKTSFAISQDETRFALKGALFSLQNGEMRMVSSDGHRLAYIRRPHAGEATTPKEVIVPRKALEEIRKLLDEDKSEEAASHLDVVGSHLIFKKEKFLLTSRLIEGQFPPYDQVIPKGYKKRAILNKEAFLGALKRVSLLSNEKSRPVRFDIQKGEMTLRSNSPELGEAVEGLEIDYNGENMHISFNARYLIDVLAVIEEETVFLELGDHFGPAILRPQEDTGYLCVVMPMRL